MIFSNRIENYTNKEKEKINIKQEEILKMNHTSDFKKTVK